MPICEDSSGVVVRLSRKCIGVTRNDRPAHTLATCRDSVLNRLDSLVVLVFQCERGCEEVQVVFVNEIALLNHLGGVYAVDFAAL